MTTLSLLVLNSTVLMHNFENPSKLLSTGMLVESERIAFTPKIFVDLSQL